MSRALLLVLVLLVTVPAAALTPGGGSPLSDCLAEFGGTAANTPARNPRHIRCVDNDPTCDDDPDLGVCRFRTQVCFNVTDPDLPLCAPADLEDYVVENEQPDTNPLHDFDLQGLEDQINFVTLPVSVAQQGFCSSEVGMTIYLPVRLRTAGAVFRGGRKTLRTTVSGPDGTEDDDRLHMICQPDRQRTACDDVTSTFDQIQRHVFTPTSCARSTCHNVQQDPHNLSLSPGEAYANLVGVAPSNAVAAAAGRLRVDPGIPNNSFLLDKLRDLLVPGEGERMPLDLPMLRARTIQLIEEWIAAGAPETGFVTSVGCQE